MRVLSAMLAATLVAAGCTSGGEAAAVDAGSAASGKPGTQGAGPRAPLLVRLEHGGCANDCPEYRLEVLQDGAVEFLGLRHVEPLAWKSWKLKPGDLESIKAALSRSALAGLQAPTAEDELGESITLTHSGLQSGTRQITFQPAFSEQPEAERETSRRLLSLVSDLERVIGTWEHAAYVEPPRAAFPRIVRKPPPSSSEPPPHPALSRPIPACDPPRPKAVVDDSGVRITGRVLVSFVVTAEGRVDQVRSLSSTAPTQLMATVESWLRACPFRPAVMGGRKAVAVRMTQAFNFK